MATVTDYLVLSDGSFELNELDSQTGFNFELDSNFVPGTRFAKPILAFIINPLTSNAGLDIFVGSDPGGIENTLQKVERITALRLSGPQPVNLDLGLWEAFSGTILTPDTVNTVNFSWVEGRIRVRDVVLWHQRRVQD